MDLVARNEVMFSKLNQGIQIVKSRSRPLLPLWLCWISIFKPRPRKWWFHVALNGVIGTENIFRGTWDCTR